MIDLVIIIKYQYGPIKLELIVFLGIIYTYAHKKKPHTSYAQTDFEYAILNHSFMSSLGFMHCGIHFYELLITPRLPPLIPRSRQ